jgi:hypothetical protein
MFQRATQPLGGWSLYLTVEAVVHDDSKWDSSFAEEGLAVCTKRLKDYGYLR